MDRYAGIQTIGLPSRKIPFLSSFDRQKLIPRAISGQESFKEKKSKRAFSAQGINSAYLDENQTDVKI